MLIMEIAHTEGNPGLGFAIQNAMKIVSSSVALFVKLVNLALISS
jgi:hypothetical protein